MHRLQTIAGLAIGALLVRVLITILLEYRWYFPPDFDESAFLFGREDSFFGLYGTAFYAHIVAGPLVIVAGTFLMLTGKRAQWRQLHRPVGKVLLLSVLGVLVPSGLIMAWRPIAGPIAGFGLASLAIATGACAAVAFYHARAGQIGTHRIWASRCFLLLCSPLLLRLIAGATIVTGLESEWTYRMIAWLSWLVPLAIFELWVRHSSHGDVQSESESITTTILPPNSPSCAIGGTEAVDGHYSAGGPHPGGIQAVLADGSVQFTSLTIDVGDQSHPPLQADQLDDGPVSSPYGVWGA